MISDTKFESACVKNGTDATSARQLKLTISCQEKYKIDMRRSVPRLLFFTYHAFLIVGIGIRLVYICLPVALNNNKWQLSVTLLYCNDVSVK